MPTLEQLEQARNEVQFFISCLDQLARCAESEDQRLPEGIEAEVGDWHAGRAAMLALRNTVRESTKTGAILAARTFLDSVSRDVISVCGLTATNAHLVTLELARKVLRMMPMWAPEPAERQDEVEATWEVLRQHLCELSLTTICVGWLKAKVEKEVVLSRARIEPAHLIKRPSDVNVPAETSCTDPITLDQAAALVRVGRKTIYNRGRKTRPDPVSPARGRKPSIYRYSELRLWLLRQFPKEKDYIPSGYSDAKSSFSKVSN